MLDNVFILDLCHIKVIDVSNLGNVHTLYLSDLNDITKESLNKLTNVNIMYI